MQLLQRSAVSSDKYLLQAFQLLELFHIDGFQRRIRMHQIQPSRFHLHERNRPVLDTDEIYLATELRSPVSVPGEDFVSLAEPACRNSLSPRTNSFTPEKVHR